MVWQHPDQTIDGGNPLSWRERMSKGMGWLKSGLSVGLGLLLGVLAGAVLGLVAGTVLALILGVV